MLKTPQYSYYYARNILFSKRFPAGEEVISRDPKQSFWYALNIIGGRWKPGERVIKTDDYYYHQYQKNVLKLYTSSPKKHYYEFNNAIFHNTFDTGEDY